MAYMTASMWIKVSFLCLWTSLVLFAIGFATISWMNSGNDDYSDDWGLWRRKTCKHEKCTLHTLDKNNLSVYGIADSHRAVQGLESISLICLGIALLIILLFLYNENMRRRKLLLAIIALTFAAVLFMVIGFILIAFQFDYDTHNHRVSLLSPGWSMWLAVAACPLAFIAGVTCVIGLNR